MELGEKDAAAKRQLAKRQLIWLRSMDSLTDFDCLANDLVEQVLRYLQTMLDAND